MACACAYVRVYIQISIYLVTYKQTFLFFIRIISLAGLQTVLQVCYAVTALITNDFLWSLPSPSHPYQTITFPNFANFTAFYRVNYPDKVIFHNNINHVTPYAPKTRQIAPNLSCLFT